MNILPTDLVRDHNFSINAKQSIINYLNREFFPISSAVVDFSIDTNLELKFKDSDSARIFYHQYCLIGDYQQGSDKISLTRIDNLMYFFNTIIGSQELLKPTVPPAARVDLLHLYIIETLSLIHI